METIQQHRTGNLLPFGYETGEEELGREREKEEAADCVMVSTISSFQANLQHSIAAYRVLTKRVVVKGIKMALIHKPWYCKGHITGQNIPGYTLFYVS
jgi:hypothetical protein